MMWRTGRKVGRTIYEQRGAEPRDEDSLIGVMDTPELAAQVVDDLGAAIIAANLRSDLALAEESIEQLSEDRDSQAKLLDDLCEIVMADPSLDLSYVEHVLRHRHASWEGWK